MTKTAEKPVTQNYVFWNGTERIDLEVSDTPKGFWFRLRTLKETGNWTGYDFIARAGDYAAVTDYYDGTFPTWEPFKIVRTTHDADT